MEKNYYEILEVDKNASDEIIKKSYSTLAKKYHPDLQPENMKQSAENKLKLINEAYEVLSNSEKRKNYDSLLMENTISKEQYDFIYIENQKLKNIIQEMQIQLSQSNEILNNIYYNNQKNHFNNSMQENNNDDYSQFSEYDNKNNYIYNNRFTNYIKNIIAIIGTILILLLLWQIPFIQSIFKDNALIESLFNSFSNF